MSLNVIRRGWVVAMGHRAQAYIRYAPLLLLCVFPHQMLLIGTTDNMTGVLIAPYVFVPALAFPIGAGVVIHIGEEFFTQKACLNLYRVQLALSVALIALGCLHPVLLYLHRAGEFFYYLYPLQQAVLFVSYALTPSVHVYAAHAERNACAQKPYRGLSRGWKCDYWLRAVADAFLVSLFMTGCLLLPFSVSHRIGFWLSLVIAAPLQLTFGILAVASLVRTGGSWIDSRFWAVWPMRFIGSVVAWPVAVGALGHDVYGVMTWTAVLGFFLVVSRVWFRRSVLSGDVARDDPCSQFDLSSGQYPVPEMALQLQRAFPDAALADRERHCIEMALAGMTSAQIAAELGIKSVTVRSYLVRAYRKLGVSDLKALAGCVRDVRQPVGEESDNRSPAFMGGEGERAHCAFLCAPADLRSLFAMLLLMVVLSEPGLSSDLFAFAVSCMVIAGVTMRAIGTGLPFDLRARPARIAFETAALSSIVLFELLASGLTSASRVPSFACVAISMCALLFVPYLLHMALFGGEESPGREPGACAKLLFPYLLSGAVFLVVVSTVPKAREIAFFTLFLFVCVDRIGIWRALATRADTCESIPGDVSYLHTHHFIPFFMAGVVVGVCAQTALHIGAELGGDVMLALPLALLAVGCCLYLRRRGCVGGWRGGAVALGAVATIAVGYWFEGSARLGTAYVLLVLWATVACFRDSPSWRAAVHALMFGAAAGASMSLMEFEVRFVMVRALRGLDGVLPAAFDIEFRSLILVGLLVACALCALYELRTASLEDAPALPEDAFQRILSYCHGRGLSELQGLVVAYTVCGESARQTALRVGYSVGSVNSARLAAYKLLRVHTRDELLELVQRELGLSKASGLQ